MQPESTPVMQITGLKLQVATWQTLIQAERSIKIYMTSSMGIYLQGAPVTLSNSMHEEPCVHQSLVKP